MHDEIYFRTLIEQKLLELKLDGNPPRLYEPIRYMLYIGGKRFRPALLLMSFELFAENTDDAINQAVAIEVFHNFTLLHDDIMDKAPLRRAQETVHRKWSQDVAILSGDTMFVQSCQLMMKLRNEYLQGVLDMFLKTAISVCEGQQLDMDFESSSAVSIEEYLNMISLKTASLIGCSSFVGALCAGAGIQDSQMMYEFGKNLGVAFQLHDDILDVYGEAEKFGKQVGGDILANKKTYLLLTALNKAAGKTKLNLEKILREKNFIPLEKISSVKDIYETLGVRNDANEKMEFYFQNAINSLNKVNAKNSKEKLLQLAERMMVRES